MNQSTSTPTTRSVVVERQLPHPPEKVWRALTQAPLIDEWIMKNDFQAIAGHKFTFRAEPMPHWDGVVYCEVTEVETHARLSYTWGVGADTPNGLKTVVTWTLTPADGGTHLRMEQSGFRAGQDAAFNGANYGWNRFFGNLEGVLGKLA